MDEAGSELRLLNCLQCGYSLVGLPRGRACPECGFDFAEDTLFVEISRASFTSGRPDHLAGFASAGILFLVAIIAVFAGFHAVSCSLFLMVIGLGIFGLSRHVLRNPRRLVGGRSRRPTLVLATNVREVRIYDRGSLYFCRGWRPGYFAEIRRGPFGQWTGVITERMNGHSNHIVSITFSATKEQAALVRDEVVRCIEAAHASVPHRELER